MWLTFYKAITLVDARLESAFYFHGAKFLDINFSRHLAGDQKKSQKLLLKL